MRRPFLFKINFTQWSRRVAFASSRSQFGRVRHQAWLEYCLFIQTWIPPQACDSRPWSGPGHRTRGFLFCISFLTHPAACPRFSQHAPRTATKGPTVIQTGPQGAEASHWPPLRALLAGKGACWAPLVSLHQTMNFLTKLVPKPIGSPIKSLAASANFWRTFNSLTNYRRDQRSDRRAARVPSSISSALLQSRLPLRGR